MMQNFKFSILPGLFTIHRLPVGAEIPAEIYNHPFYSITKTDDEISILVAEGVKLKSEKSEEDWKCLKILGPLDFEMTGVLAEISSALADEEISIFAVSTFDTDYILVKNEKLNDAVKALESQGYKLKNGD